MTVKKPIPFTISIVKEEFKTDLPKYLNTLKYEGETYVLVGPIDIIFDILVDHDEIITIIDNILKQGFKNISFMINESMDRQKWLANMLAEGYSITEFKAKWAN